jgi:dipeptidyl aminopeptidase/acylaminoacyl peptidase
MRIPAVALFVLLGAAPVGAQTRAMRPDDLFRYERAGGIAWSADRTHAAVELHRPTSWIGGSLSSADLAVVDVATATLKVIASPDRDVIGFFGASWSPDGARLSFFSIDREGRVRPWLWAVGGSPPAIVADLQMADGLADSPRAIWTDTDHVVLLLHDPARPNDGPLYFAATRGRNSADEWQTVRAGREAAVAVFDSQPGATSTRARLVRLVSLDVRTRKTTTLAEGAIHAPRLAADGRTLSYRVENPAIPAAPVAAYLGSDAKGDAAYDRVNFGGDERVIDPHTGATVPVPDASSATRGAGTASSGASLRIVNAAESGTSLVLSRADHADEVLWRGNAWVREIRTGRVERIDYRSADGRPQVGWLLYPPDAAPGRKIPIVTLVYPGDVYDERSPALFNLLSPRFDHPQLFAALGYGVLVPSMPQGETPLQIDSVSALAGQVEPLVDVVISRGIADPRRIAVVGHSAGGWATLGLITTTDRFRTAIASASYGDLVSMYGTFYGQYRYGDAGLAERAQILRMLQFERAVFGAGAPPWEQPERYRVNSPLWRVASVHTPLLLVHGDKDFVPVQQAEEFFTALYRQDKRVELVRYAGEEHTIALRENVLDLWRRIEQWLRDTMAESG